MPNSHEGSDDEADINKACELVGRFFYHWAHLEMTINRTIATLFGVKSVEGLILTTNMQFRDRLHIVNTALRFKGDRTDEWIRRVKKTIARISRLNSTRNLMAHTAFFPLKSGHVDFFHIEAKGTLNAPDTIWHPKQFQCQFDLIIKANEDLRKLTRDLQVKQGILEALMKEPKPNSASPGMGGLLGLGSLGLLNFPAQTAIPEIDPQTPQKPQQKAEEDRQ